MKNIPDKSVDMILCDLPYGATSISWDKALPLPDLWNNYERVLKDKGAIVLFANTLFSVALINSNMKMFRYKMIWKKNVPTGMSSAKYRPMKYYEEICVFANGKTTYNPILKPRVGVGKDCYRYDHYCGSSNHVQYQKVKKKYNPEFVQPSDVLEFDVVPNRKGKLHSTQKPVPLLEYLIRTYSNEEEVILDNCMGSGSTGVACANTNRKFIGIELVDKYFDIAKSRIEDAYSIVENTDNNNDTQ